MINWLDCGTWPISEICISIKLTNEVCILSSRARKKVKPQLDGAQKHFVLQKPESRQHNLSPFL